MKNKKEKQKYLKEISEQLGVVEGYLPAVFLYVAANSNRPDEDKISFRDIYKMCAQLILKELHAPGNKTADPFVASQQVFHFIDEINRIKPLVRGLVTTKKEYDQTLYYGELIELFVLPKLTSLSVGTKIDKEGAHGLPTSLSRLVSLVSGLYETYVYFNASNIGFSYNDSRESSISVAKIGLSEQAISKWLEKTDVVLKKSQVATLKKYLVTEEK